MKKLLALLSLLVCCFVPEDEGGALEQPRIFTNKWWEMESGPSIGGMGDDCFMLNDVDHHTGGSLISHSNGQGWPYFTYHAWWEYSEDEDSIIIIEQQYEVEITPKGDRCWHVQYSIFAAIACGCTYDTTNVDYLVE